MTRCYIQNILSPYMNSRVNHKRHFIKTQFINKGMEFIDLHSIFKDRSVISSDPNYFINKLLYRNICDKYNKVCKEAKIRTGYNQVPYQTQDTIRKVTKTQ